MNIAIDCRMIDRSGIGTVIQELVPRFLESPNRFVLLGDPERLDCFAGERAQIVAFKEPIYSIGEQIRFPRPIFRYAGVLLCPHYNVPITAFSRVAVIVHDLAHLVLPDFFAGVAKRFYAHLFFRVLLRNAARIITPSEFTRNEIIKHLSIRGDRVMTILNGPGRSFGASTDFCSQRLDRYGVNTPYILAVGNLKPHKNLELLLDAFLIVRQTEPNLRLVLTGRSFGETKCCESLGLENVVLTGHVADEDMPALYSNATLYVTPSLYEGFGLTPLEALRFRTLPLVSDAAALPEVIQDPDLRFEPNDSKDLANKILTFLNNPELRDRKLSEQKRVLERFSWDSAAKSYLSVLECIGTENRR